MLVVAVKMYSLKILIFYSCFPIFLKMHSLCFSNKLSNVVSSFKVDLYMRATKNQQKPTTKQKIRQNVFVNANFVLNLTTLNGRFMWVPRSYASVSIWVSMERLQTTLRETHGSSCFGESVRFCKTVHLPAIRTRLMRRRSSKISADCSPVPQQVTRRNKRLSSSVAAGTRRA